LSTAQQIRNRHVIAFGLGRPAAIARPIVHRWPPFFG
jgi:hypothetical protein